MFQICSFLFPVFVLNKLNRVHDSYIILIDYYAITVKDNLRHSFHHLSYGIIIYYHRYMAVSSLFFVWAENFQPFC